MQHFQLLQNLISDRELHFQENQFPCHNQSGLDVPHFVNLAAVSSAQIANTLQALFAQVADLLLLRHPLVHTLHLWLRQNQTLKLFIQSRLAWITLRARLFSTRFFTHCRRKAQVERIALFSRRHGPEIGLIEIGMDVARSWLVRRSLEIRKSAALSLL